MDQIRIETLGCRLNQIESESAAKFFIDNGFSVSMKPLTASEDENPEILLSIINTCTVTQKAEQKARRLIRLILKKFPNAAVLVTGCYAQLSPKEICQIDRRVCVIGGQMKSRIAEIPPFLKDYLSKNKWDSREFASLINHKIEILPQKKNDFPEDSFKLSTSSFISHSRASLKIQDGCNSNCSYCAIHMARGHSVSIPVQTAVERVQELEKAGQTEVVITTVNIGQYRADFEGQVYNFTKLLKKLLDSTSTIMFRISSLYPEVVDEEFCQVIKNPRVCPHFHLSVQSGSDKVLKLMNRQYGANTVEDSCRKLKAAKNQPFLACDIITGFPGETDEDFELTMKLCQNCGFAWVHAFPYSERPGTAAVSCKNKVPQSVSGERSKRLTEWAIASKIKYIEEYAGRELSAVFETVRRPAVLSAMSSEYIYHAVTENFIHCEVHFKDGNLANKAHRIRIVKALPERISKGGEIEALGELL